MGYNSSEIVAGAGYWARPKTIPPIPWDVYWEYDYAHICSLAGDGAPFFFLYKRCDYYWFHVFMKRNISNSRFYDCKSPYGYSGPLANCDDSEFIFEANAAFYKWACEQNIVCEFVRFHPLLRTHKWAVCPEMTIEFNRKTTSVDLTKSLDEIESGMSPAFLRGVRKAIASGLEFSELSISQINEFVKLYNQTMISVNAAPYYFFPPEYFKGLSANGLNTRLFGVTLKDKLLAAAIIFESDSFFHYHLGASDRNYLNLRPNNLLFYNLVVWAYKKGGKKRFHFGGGTDSTLENSLFKFKRSFAPDLVDFFIGKRIFLSNVYDELSSKALEKKPEERLKTVNFNFPLYRALEK